MQTKEPSSKHSRRAFIRTSVLSAGGLTIGLQALSNGGTTEPLPAAESVKHNILAGTGPICLFSKPLQFLQVPEMATALAAMGFNGIDLTIRKGGHVEPATAVTDLPIAVASIRKAGLEVPMVVTEILDPKHSLSEPILKTLANLGIKQYRTAYTTFKPELGVAKSLEVFKKDFVALAALNKKYGVKGAYQNHSGVRLGSSVWDLWTVLKDADPQWMGIQYDPKHACIEGQQSWVHSFELVKDYVHSINIKDFHWHKKGQAWQQLQVPLGEGMVDFKKFFNLVKQYNLNVPVSLHLEYALGGAENGNKTITIPKEELLGHVKKDLGMLKAMLNTANLV